LNTGTLEAAIVIASLVFGLHPENAVDLLRVKHKHGDVYYWLLYYSFLSPQQFRNVEEASSSCAHISRTSSFLPITASGSRLWRR